MIEAESLQSLLDDHQLFHSEFQMDYLITTRAGGTAYGCYKQALRELSKRYRGLKGLYAERELLQIDLEQLSETVSGVLCCKYKTRRRQVKITQKKMAIEETHRAIRDTEREFRRFHAQAVALREQIGELTPARRAQLDVDMWRHRLKCMAAVDIITHNALGTNTVEFLASTPPDLRKPLMEEINDAKRLLSWFYSQHAELPSLAIDGPCDMEKLLCRS